MIPSAVIDKTAVIQRLLDQVNDTAGVEWKYWGDFNLTVRIDGVEARVEVDDGRLAIARVGDPY